MPTPDTVKSDADKTNNSKENFGPMVEYADKIVGRIEAKVKELGLDDNTIIFFTGDNGSAGAGKSEATEQGARVPMIINGPGIVKARGKTKELTDTSDVFPTLIELAGGELPKDRPIDGQSLAKFIKGETNTHREWAFAFQGDYRILRTKRWLIENNRPLKFGKMFDCGDSRDGTGYKDVTDSTDPEVTAAREQLMKILEGLPAPIIEQDGAPNSAKDSSDDKRATKREGRQRPREGDDATTSSERTRRRGERRKGQEAEAPVD